MWELQSKAFLPKKVVAEHIIADFAELCYKAVNQQKQLWRNKRFPDSLKKNNSALNLVCTFFRLYNFFVSLMHVRNFYALNVA